MKQYFQRLFAYDTWANQRIISMLQQLPGSDERCLHLLSHIFAAQQIWHGRITGSASHLAPFPGWNFQECHVIFLKMSKSWDEYLRGIRGAELKRVVSYTNTKGESFSTQVKDILTHVINHSTYHRAQIVFALKGKVEKLPVTDFIAFARE